MGELRNLSGSTILLVDDDPSVLAMLRAVLENQGYVVTAAVSAADAKEKLAGGRFEVVITDMRMESETSGFDVVREARRSPEPPATIIVTAYPMLEQTWRDEGADAALMKGGPIVQLIEAVQQLISNREAHC